MQILNQVHEKRNLVHKKLKQNLYDRGPDSAAVHDVVINEQINKTQ